MAEAVADRLLQQVRVNMFGSPIAIVLAKTRAGGGRQPLPQAGGVQLPLARPGRMPLVMTSMMMGI